MGNKILIVDDDEDLLRLLSAAFKSQGFEVEGFVNGKAAIGFLSNEKNIESLCLLILDRMLPDMDGLDILRFFVEKYKSKLPILILSVLSSEKDTLEGLQKGAVDYVAKPFSVNILLQKARKLIAGS